GVGGLSLFSPLLFLFAMACGVGAHVAAVNIPGAELIAALSVLAAGALLATGRFVHLAWWLALFVVAGFFHGYAYGESIFGAESTPLAAYLAGLVVVQAILTVGVALVTRTLWQSKLGTATCRGCNWRRWVRCTGRPNYSCPLRGSIVPERPPE